jgi:hypothetical protein
LKSPTIIVSGPIWPYMSNSVCFMKLGAQSWVHIHLKLFYFLDGLFPFLICSNHFYPFWLILALILLC